MNGLEAGGWDVADTLVKGEPSAQRPTRGWWLPNRINEGVGLNTLNGLRALADYDSDAFMFLQDDAVLAAGARRYIEQTWPGDGVLWCFIAKRHAHDLSQGWNVWPEGRQLYGSLAVVLHRSVLDKLLPDSGGAAGNNLEVLRGWDIQFYRWLRSNGVPLWVHRPSLVRHVGATSVCHPGMLLSDNRREDSDVIADAGALL